MLKIEPIEEVVTTRKLIVTIDEEEIAHILVDPRDFQKALRQQKRNWNGHSTWSETGHATRAARKTSPPPKKNGDGPRREVPEVPQGFQGAGAARGELYGEPGSAWQGGAVFARRVG